MPTPAFTFNQSDINNSVNNNIAVLLKQAGMRVNGDIKLTRLTEGFSEALVYKVENSGNAYTLKIFPARWGMDVANTFYKFASGNGIPTPKILHSSGPSEACPGHFVLTEWVDSELLNKIGKWGGQYGYGKEAGILLKRVHGIKTGGFGFLNSKNQWTCRSAAAICDLWIKRISDKLDPCLSNMWQEILEKTLMSNRLRDFSNPVLLHGDFCVNNIFYQKKLLSGKIVGLIDAAGPVSGDPMSDLGNTQTTNSAHLISKGIWDGYTKRQKLTEEEHNRFLRWRLVHQFFAICKSIICKDNKTSKLLKYIHPFMREVD